MLTNERLERQIEKLIRDHLAECREAAVAVVTRAFTAVMDKPEVTRQAKKSTTRVPGPRRSREELAALTETLYEAVCAMPGEKMTVLAAHLGVPSRRLQLPAKRLKEANQVRTAGQRQHMRYFPMPRAQAENPRPLSVEPDMDERNTSPAGSLLEKLDGPVLVGLGNWLSESLDASELEPEQVLLLHTILDHCLKRLWRTFPEVLLPLALRIIAQLEKDDDEP